MEPPGDADDGRKAPAWEHYRAIVRRFHEATGQGTFASVKKNIIVDLVRMGLLKRRKDGNAYFTSLTPQGKCLISQDTPPHARYKLWSNALETLVEPVIADLFQLLYTDSDFDDNTARFTTRSISKEEYAFIFSDDQIDYGRKVELLKSYRSLNRFEQAEVVAKIRAKSSASLAAPTARKQQDMIDYGNWMNQAAETFARLNQTLYFKTYNREVLMMALSQEVWLALLRRNPLVKGEALTWHAIARRFDEFELHHVVPLEMARSDSEWQALDNKMNLIYVPKKTHKKIHEHDRIIQMFNESGQLVLKTPATGLNSMMLEVVDAAHPGSLDLSRDLVVLKPANLSEMLSYNESLLRMAA